ncbi:MAG: NAD(P)H-dependent glycerol-3-phosphate dehydrogenase [candidate division Zixibacteria bacterium]|nr:NAD(P)H-dependent glycerol-3-phosphate dehydrogenase [candidate division Zixibacteria bacterium]
MVEKKEKITVLGAGSWGIAIGNLLFNNGHKMKLWEFSPDDYKVLLEHRTHPKKLPEARIPEDILITNILSEAIQDADYIVLAVPSQNVRDVCNSLKPIIKNAPNFINLAKGVEVGSLLRVSEVVGETIPGFDNNKFAVLSGPSHAEEVTRDMPTSIVTASVNPELAKSVQRIFSNKTFRVYRSSDLNGVELGGSLKNIIAIGSGILHGLGLGDNTSGALITRGLAEITRLGVKLGADAETFSGLSGIGDLIATCLSKHSRNRYVGERIGRGEKLQEILDSMVMVAEGVYTCQSAQELSEKYKVEMPITNEVYKVLFKNKSAKEAVNDLMTRSLKKEVWN